MIDIPEWIPGVVTKLLITLLPRFFKKKPDVAPIVYEADQSSSIVSRRSPVVGEVSHGFVRATKNSSVEIEDSPYIPSAGKNIAPKSSNN